MFKTKIVNSRNIRKTLAYKVIQILLIPILLFIVAMSFGIFGPDSSITTVFRENQSNVIRPIAIVIIILGVGFSIVAKSRMKNPIHLGYIEIDENGFKILNINNSEYIGSWNNTRFISFEFFSSANINNPQGCMNYLTIIDNNGPKTYEILVESSLLKADLGEILRELNRRIPVKISFTIPIKKLIRDNDLKLS